MRVRVRVCVVWPIFNFWDPLHIFGTAVVIESNACSAFDAAFAKLLWHLVRYCHPTIENIFWHVWFFTYNYTAVVTTYHCRLDDLQPSLLRSNTKTTVGNETSFYFARIRLVIFCPTAFNVRTARGRSSFLCRGGGPECPPEKPKEIPVFAGGQTTPYAPARIYRRTDALRCKHNRANTFRGKLPCNPPHGRWLLSQWRNAPPQMPLCAYPA